MFMKTLREYGKENMIFNIYIYHSKKMKELMTIVTPTYNRVHTLEKCYNSLCDQTNKEFIWMVIDDGSTDDTERLVENLIKKNKIKIEYYKKENGGKASALNFAVDKVKTKYCACLDSDEYFSDDAIKIALNNLEIVENNEKVCGILALRRDKEGKVLGGKEIPSKVNFIKYIDINDKYNINSEVICFYKTKILKKYKFPEFENENFVSPAFVQYEITREYQYKVFREPIIFCEYLEDGLTRNKNKVIRRNPKGYLAVKKLSFELSKNIVKKIKHGIMYEAVSILDNDKNLITKSSNKLLLIILYPISYLIYRIKFKE